MKMGRISRKIESILDSNEFLRMRIKPWLKKFIFRIRRFRPPKRILLTLLLKDYGRREHIELLKCYFHNRRTYRDRWRSIRQQYDIIFVYGIEFVGIGETVCRLFKFIEEKGRREDNCLHLVLPTFFSYYKKGIFNRATFEVFREEIDFILPDDICFWLYVIRLHPTYFDISRLEYYVPRFGDCVLVPFNKPVMPIPKHICDLAKQEMINMGVEGDYICLHARESRTKTENFDDSYLDTSVCDWNIATAIKACRFFDDKNTKIIRIGKDEEKECKIEGVIDYANKYWKDYMDFYLISHCSFLIGSGSGISSITPFWGRPALYINYVGIVHSWDYVHYTCFDMYIPKEFYSSILERPLCLKEVLDISNECDRYKENYDSKGVRIIDNNEEDILNATIEMYEKISGKWVVTDEENEMMQLYWTIMDEWKQNHRTGNPHAKVVMKDYAMVPLPIAFSYLKSHTYLLEDYG